MKINERIDDEYRKAHAKKERGLMRGPWELGHCEHGRVYSFRWIWSPGEGIEGGDMEMGKCSCQKCEAAS